MRPYGFLGGEIRSNNNLGNRRAYHVVWCPKYRRKVIDERGGTRLKQIIAEGCAERGATIVGVETMPDQVRLLVSVDPQFGIHRLVKQIKGRSSRLPRAEFPHLKSRIPTPRTNSHFVATTGGATLDVVKHYVETQRGKQLNAHLPVGYP